MVNKDHIIVEPVCKESIKGMDIGFWLRQRSNMNYTRRALEEEWSWKAVDPNHIPTTKKDQNPNIKPRSSVLNQLSTGSSSTGPSSSSDSAKKNSEQDHLFMRGENLPSIDLPSLTMEQSLYFFKIASFVAHLSFFIMFFLPFVRSLQ